MIFFLSLAAFFLVVGGIGYAALQEERWNREAEDAQRRVNERILAIQEGKY